MTIALIHNHASRATTAMDQTFDCSHVVDIAEEPRHHLVLENEFVRAFAVEIPPQDRTLCHRHPREYLLYVASGSEIISAARGEEPKRLSYGDGECELSVAGLVHVVENLGAKPFRNVVVELSPRAGELRRGANPSRTIGEISFSRLLDEERAAVLSIEIAPGAEVEISGPAVVATPEGNKLTPDAIDAVEVRSHSTCDIAWIPPGGAVVLWGCWEQAERAIVFQIGRTEEQGFAVSNVRDPLRSLRAHVEPE
jgi:hypothetical protein